MPNFDSAAAVGEMLKEARLHTWGLDWLTTTTASARTQTSFKVFWARKTPQLERLGYKQKKGGFQGYNGISCGPLFLGERPDGMLIRASGHLSKELYDSLDLTDCKATRVDVQATIEFPSYKANVAELLGDTRQAAARAAGQKMKPKQHLDMGYGDGDTLYIGSRSSPRFGRVYDKMKQADDGSFLNCWRFELEYKRLMAPKIIQVLAGEREVENAILDILEGQFMDWGLPLGISAAPLVVAGSIGRRQPDTDRSMTWLRNQVAPTVERLLGTIAPHEIMTALGLLTDISPTEWRMIERAERGNEYDDVIPF